MIDILGVNSVSIPEDVPVRRTPPRSPFLRYSDYLEKFDDRTLFFDVFLCPNRGNTVVAIGPKLRNLWTDLQPKFFDPRNNTELQVKIDRLISVDIITINCETPLPYLILETSFFEAKIHVSPSKSESFNQKNCAITLQKDNDPIWIKDWIQFYSSEHGADTFIIYDNNSERYSPDNLGQLLSEHLPDGCHVSIMSWPFKYGPNDHRRPHTIWLADSDYCQRGMLEHARRRFLTDAAGVISVDIDELIFRENRMTLYDALKISKTGYIEVPGVMIEANTASPSETVRHKNYFKIGSSETVESSPAKWAAVPSKLSPTVQWSQHSVVGANICPQSSNFCFGHFRAINTNWDLHSPNTLSISRTGLDPDKQTVDLIPLKQALSRAFGAETDEREIDFANRTKALCKEVRKQKFSVPEISDDKDGSSLDWKYNFHRSVIAPIYGSGFQEALDFAKAGMQIDPHNFYLISVYCRHLEEDENFEDLYAYLKTIDFASIKRFRTTILSIYAHAALQTQRFSEAIVILDECFSLGAWHPGYHCLAAQALERAGQVSRAEEELRRAVSKATSSRFAAETIALQAELLDQTGMNRLPNTHCAEGYSAFRVQLAHTVFLLHQNRAEDAVASSRDLIELDPVNGRAWFHASRCWKLSADLEKEKECLDCAITTMEKKYQYGPDFTLGEVERNYWQISRARELVLIYIRAGLHAKALEAFSRYLQKGSFDTDTVFNLLRDFWRHDFSDPVLDLAFSKLQKKPEGIQNFGDLSVSYHLEQGNLRSAAEAAKMTSQTNQLWALGKLFSKLMKESDFSSAVQVAEKISDIDPENVNSIVRLSSAHIKQGNFSVSLRHAKEAVRRYPTDVRGHIFRANSLIGERNFPEAKASIDESLQIHPQDVTLLRLQERIRKRIG